jgi:hypothetical protein
MVPTELEATCSTQAATIVASLIAYGTNGKSGAPAHAHVVVAKSAGIVLSGSLLKEVESYVTPRTSLKLLDVIWLLAMNIASMEDGALGHIGLSALQHVAMVLFLAFER